MRRAMLLAGMWMVGVAVAVTFAFAAVGRVAHGVAPRDTARLSQAAIDAVLSSPSTSVPTATTRPKPPARGVTSTTGSTAPPTTGSRSTQPTSVTTGTTSNAPPPVTATTVSPPPTVSSQNTATPSRGGTIFTRCSGPNSIEYVAAIPNSGYQRTGDVESSTGISQTFRSETHVSRIDAGCVGGTVRAHVEEDSAD